MVTNDNFSVDTDDDFSYTILTQEELETSLQDFLYGYKLEQYQLI